MRSQFKLQIAALLLGILSCPPAFATVVAVGPGSFPAGSTLIDFAGLASGTEVNGLTASGALFNYMVGGSPLNGAVVIDGGPGTTNNITPPNIVSVGNNSGTLTIALPNTASIFGYGYAILTTVSVANATTISLFSGSTSVGSLSYNATPDPTFTGGFAGIQSTIPFDRVAVTFNSVAAPAFALDDVRFNTIPEPSTMWLVLSSAVGALVWRRRTLLAAFRR